MRELRIENEWRLLEQAAVAMPERLGLLRRERDAAGGESFSMRVTGMPALSEQPAGAGWMTATRYTHTLRIGFPRFFPAMPIEVFVLPPVFHPNAHPETGFLCIWSTHRAAHTVLGALARTAAVLRWALVNRETDHVMQPEALRWWIGLNPEQAACLPLPADPLPLATDSLPEAPAAWRKRLSPC